MTGVRRRWGVGLQAQDRGASPDHVEEVGAAQLVGDGDGVDRFADAVERHHRVVDVGVGRLVEVGGLYPRFGRRADCIARQEHGPEQRFFGFQVVRRDAAALLTAHFLDRLDHSNSRSQFTGVHLRFTSPMPRRFYVRKPVQWKGIDPETPVTFLGISGGQPPNPCAHRARLSTGLWRTRTGPGMATPYPDGLMGV